MATSTLATFRANLVTQIAAQLTTDAVTGVTVHRFPNTAHATREDRVELGPIRATQIHLAQDGSRSETLEAEGAIFAAASGGTDDESTEAETRALLILASVENTLRADPSVSAAVFHAQVAEYESDPFADDEGWVGYIRFTITAEAHL